jgi:hypothetical protein
LGTQSGIRCTAGRHYLLPIFLVTPPGWRPDLRDRFGDEFKLPKDTQHIDAPTPYVWIIGRIKTDGPPDYDAVHKIQAGLKITPLSEWGKPAKPVEVKIDPSIDMKTPPKIQVDTMPAGKYFGYAAELLLHAPSSAGLNSLLPPYSRVTSSLSCF